MLKVYGADLSSPANKVRFLANAANIPYEYIKVNLRGGENKTEEYLRMHPAGKIPAINDDGFCLFESNAICRYLAIKHSSNLYPAELKQRAVVDQWMDFVSIHVGGAMSKVLFNKVFAPIIKVPVDNQSMKDGYQFLDRFLPVIEGQLSKGKYLTLSEMSLADICLVSVLDPFDVAEIELSQYPAIVEFKNRLMAEEFYSRCHKSYNSIISKVLAHSQ